VAKLDPVIAEMGCAPADALRLMDHSRDFILNHLPLVDSSGRVVDLLLRSDLVSEERLGLSAVIMAGGLGTRLLPLTEYVPKPMLPLGDRPLMELTIERLRDAGIRTVNVTTHHLSEKISDHFGDGKAFGVEINYVEEDQPLGTAGGLRLVNGHGNPFLVINGDILTSVNFRSLVDYHRELGADATVGVRKYDLQIPYGVVDSEGPRVLGIREKPHMSFLANAGIYLLEPSVYHHIPDGKRFDMTDLVQRLIEKGRHVVTFPITEYWLDIGQHLDYAKAQEDLRDGTFDCA
jgi:NDP-sugar pyrophosphorylase family protein